jgi:hypothetical protein
MRKVNASYVKPVSSGKNNRIAGVISNPKISKAGKT